MAEELAGHAFYSYDLSVETKINIDELIYILTPKDLPLVHGVGADGVPLLPSQGVDNTEFFWLEEDVPLPRGTLNEVLDGSETVIDVATGDAVKFAVGDGIRIGTELMIVTAIDTTAETLTVDRGSALLTGTAATTHQIGAEIIGVGTILVEGSVGSANFQGRDKYSNFCQIFSKKMQASRTSQRIPKYGVPNELNKQMLNGIQHLSLGVEQAALLGVKHKVAATNRRSTGGFDHFVTTNVDTTTEWLTVDSIEQMLQSAYDLGGSFEYVMGVPAAFGALNNLTGNERVTTVDVSDSRRGRSRATMVMTEFGEVQLVRNRWMKKYKAGAQFANAFGMSRENFVKRVFQPLVTEKLAKSDDTDTFMMVQELGFEVKGQDHMAKWTGLNTSAPLPAVLV